MNFAVSIFAALTGPVLYVPPEKRMPSEAGRGAGSFLNSGWSLTWYHDREHVEY